MKIDLESLENRDCNNSYLKETILLSDIAVLYRHEQILWTQELGLLGMQKRPKAFFNNKSFQILSSESNYIVIPLGEWLGFSQKILNAFQLDLPMLITMKTNIETTLKRFDQCVDKAIKIWDTDKSISIPVLEELCALYSLTDAYSLLNYVIPKYYFQQQLHMEELSACHYRLDYFLVSLVEPHRNMNRRKKLEIARESNYRRSDLIDSYLLDNIYYDCFTEWLYSNGKDMQEKMLYRELNSITSTYSKKQIDDEIRNMEEIRRNYLLQRKQKLEDILRIGLQSKNEAILSLHAQLENLAFVCTEEESRHMIVCKFFYLMGAILNTYKIDVSRTSLKEIKTIIGYLS